MGPPPTTTVVYHIRPDLAIPPLPNSVEVLIPERSPKISFPSAVQAADWVFRIIKEPLIVPYVTGYSGTKGSWLCDVRLHGTKADAQRLTTLVSKALKQGNYSYEVSTREMVRGDATTDFQLTLTLKK